MNNFNRKFSSILEYSLDVNRLISEGHITQAEAKRLETIKREWNFYEGYHWEGIDDLDASQVTYNYCRPFINKFIAFELGKGFTIKSNVNLDSDEVTVNDKKVDIHGETENSKKEKMVEKSIIDFLNEVWKYNKKDTFCTEFGQNKSITGEAWVKVAYESYDEINDIFSEYENGRIRVTCIPTQFCFPEFNPHDKERMDSLLIMYPIIVKKREGILSRRVSEHVEVYKEIWTSEEIVIHDPSQEGEDTDVTVTNPYGFIPFVQVKNLPVSGRNYGISDLEDIIPLNVEYNMKKSDVSEIIDYHSAPITCVFGAKIGNLEKGANKVWGGLPKDAKVSNLELNGDLNASNNYINSLKTSMCEIGGIPETVLGGASAISNTSGVALQYINLPLIEKTRVKRACTIDGLQIVNKMILSIALQNGLIEKPEELSMKEFLHNEVTIPDTLPKDELMELQKIEQEMKLSLECRHGALARMGIEDNISDKLAEIDREREEHPEIFNPMLQSVWYQNQLNSGMTNGQTPVEQVRVETTGQNGNTFNE